MLSRLTPSRAFVAAKSRSLQPFSRSSTIAMASSKTVVYVKGDPVSKKLGDCPFCHRALLTFEAKKVPYDLEYIDFANKPAWLQEASGGKVPVIQEPGQPYMPDSDVIVVHLEEKYPQPSLKSDVPPEIGAKLFPAFRGYLMGPTEEQEDKRKQLEAELQLINDYLSKHGPLFGGKSLNATDCAVAPKLYHVLVALKHYKGWELPAGLTAIPTYMATIKALPEWQATDYGEDSILAGWKRHMEHK